MDLYLSDPDVSQICNEHRVSSTVICFVINDAPTVELDSLLNDSRVNLITIEDFPTVVDPSITSLNSRNPEEPVADNIWNASSVNLSILWKTIDKPYGCLLAILSLLSNPCAWNSLLYIKILNRDWPETELHTLVDVHHLHVGVCARDWHIYWRKLLFGAAMSPGTDL